MVKKFKEFDAPSGVKNSYFDKNIIGEKINLCDTQDASFVSQRCLSKKQSNKIKKFAKRKEK